MKNKIRLIIGLLFFVVSCLYFYDLSFDYLYRSFDIIHTNDMHGNLFSDKIKNKYYSDETGGVSIFGGFVKKIKAPKLIFDSGDIFQGTPEGDLTDGKALIEIMNQIGYDGAVCGNHEFDRGFDKFVTLTKLSNFPFIVSNVRLKNNIDNKKIVPDFVQEFKIFTPLPNFKIGVIGIVPGKFKYVTMPGAYSKIEILDEIESAKEVIEKLKKKNVNMIIALTHIGFTENDSIETINDLMLLRKLPEINFILAGHTHKVLRNGYFDNISHKYIYRTRGKLKEVDLIRIYVNKKGKIIKTRHKQFVLSEKVFGEDLDIKNIIQKYADLIGNQMNEIIGYSEVELKRNHQDESNLGDFITDIMRAKTKTEISFHNSGGIRADIKAGNISYRDLYLSSPFGNTIITMELSGKTIEDLIRKSLNNQYGSLQVSGIKIFYKITKDKTKELNQVYIGEKKIDLNRVYNVSTNNYLSEGGDDFIEFKSGNNKKNTEIKLLDVIVEYIKNNKKINIKIDGRISKI